MNNLKKTVWKSFLFLLTFALLMAAFIVPYMSKLDKFLLPAYARLMQDIFSVIPVLLASWIIMKFIEKKPFISIGLNASNIISDVLYGIGIGLFWLGLSLFGQYLFGTLVNNTINSLSTLSFVIYTVALLLNAATQEILCRGYLFTTIKEEFGVWTAVVITSILFLCMHTGAIQAGFIPSINVFGAGVIFAIAYYKTGNLWMPIAIHTVWNFVCSSILYTPISGYRGFHLFHLKGTDLLAGGVNGPEATIITTVTIIIVIIGEYLFLREQVEVTQLQQTTVKSILSE